MFQKIPQRAKRLPRQEGCQERQPCKRLPVGWGAVPGVREVADVVVLPACPLTPAFPRLDPLLSFVTMWTCSLVISVLWLLGV